MFCTLAKTVLANRDQMCSTCHKPNEDDFYKCPTHGRCVCKKCRKTNDTACAGGCGRASCWCMCGMAVLSCGHGLSGPAVGSFARVLHLVRDVRVSEREELCRLHAKDV